MIESLLNRLWHCVALIEFLLFVRRMFFCFYNCVNAFFQLTLHGENMFFRDFYYSILYTSKIDIPDVVRCVKRVYILVIFLYILLGIIEGSDAIN